VRAVAFAFPIEGGAVACGRVGDPTVLAAALPGCRSAVHADEGAGGEVLRVTVEVAVASVGGLWAGTVSRVDGDAVRVAGAGEPGRVDLVIRADDHRSTLTVEGTVDGPLATVGAAVLGAAIRRLAADTLAAAAEPRGEGFLSGEGEAMGSGSGTHDLDPRRPEPLTSPPGRRRGAATAAAGAGVVVVVLSGWRRLRRRAR
jgi:carbon monoxide dehydrogenase subunit G